MSLSIAELDLEKLTNPTFIDQPYIERFADAAHLIMAERVLNPGHTLFRQASGEASRWSIPRHFSYSSDNDVKGGGPDPAVAEIQERLIDISRGLSVLGVNKLPTVGYYDIPSQDPRAASFQLHQLGTNRLLGYGVVNGVNCAPRTNERGVLKDNAGEAIYGGFLPNGTFDFGTGGHCFSLYRRDIEEGRVEFFEMGVATKGSQFRSRDYWTFVGKITAINIPDEGVRHFADRHNPPSLEDRRNLLEVFNFIDLTKPLSTEAIPPLQEDGKPFVLISENHGNLKLGIYFGDLIAGGIAEEQKVNITVNDITHSATVTTAPFNRPAGEIALSPGSGRSPYHLQDNDKALVEVFLVGGRAEDLFGITPELLRKGVTADIVSCNRTESSTPANPALKHALARA